LKVKRLNQHFEMEEKFKRCLSDNFVAAIDMLSNAVALCPDELWHREKKVFYLAYHTTIFLDYYLTIPARDFKPALPYTIVDESTLPPEAIDDVMPDRYYSRQDVLTCLVLMRKKCRALIMFSDGDRLMQRWIADSEVNLHGLCPSTVRNYTVLEIIFYNFRHVQHHVGQLNLLLRQHTGQAPGWVAMAGEEG